ncbi:hypothetical protein FOXYSP1_17750 [Fusarium oxysporum f. sp. phaseoli]
MCYLRLLSTSTFRLREPATFRALRPSTSPSCRSTLRVVAPSLSHSPAALRCLDRPLQLLLPEQHQQPLAARLLGPSGAPLSRRTGPKWLAALFAARKLHDRSLRSCTAQRTSSSLQPRLPPGTRPGFDNLSHWLRPLDKTARSNGTELTWRPWNEATTSSTEQRSGRLGLFSCEGFPQGCTVLG